METGLYIRHGSRLDPRLRELAILQVGYFVGNHYQFAHHVEIAISLGVPEQDIRAIAEETEGRKSHLEPLARSALSAAREMTSSVSLCQETFDALRAGLDNECLVDLLFAIATYNSIVRILASLEVDLEDEYRPLLDRFPLR